MINEILSILYLLVPAYFANMAPVLVKKIDFLNFPMDLGKEFRGKRILGTNKTFRGLIAGMIFGTIVFYIQQIAYSQGFIRFAYIDYSSFSVFLGTYIGLVTIVGDAIESFVKRQLDKRPGKPWVPFDQLDFVITNFIALSFITSFSIISILIVSAIIVLGDIMVQYVGYRLGFKKDRL